MERGGGLLPDYQTLGLLGKREILKRRFNFWSLFAFAVCELITWETVLALISQGLRNGGPAGLVYGFIIASLSTFYTIGWLTVLAWIATVAIETLLAGTMVQGLIKLNYPTYDSKPWRGTLLTWAVIAVDVFVNVFIPNKLPKLELTILTIHFAGFVAIFATLLSTAKKGTAASVWLTASNQGGWPTQGLSFCVGFLGNVATFVGADASTHLSEEVANAQLNIPRAICVGMIFDIIVGFAMMIAVLYNLGDVNSVLKTPTGFPFIQIFYNSVKNVGGAIGMSVVVLILTWACSIGILTTASRMTWSFARDKGTPFSQHLSKVNQHTRIPVHAVLLVAIFAALLVLIYIGSNVAFNDVISLTVTGFYGSYFLPCALLLYHRVKGSILPYGSQFSQMPEPSDRSDQSEPTPSANGTLDTGVNPQTNLEIEIVPSASGTLPTGANPQTTLEIENESLESQLVWGPWRLPGIFGIINNAYACVYMMYVIFWSVWPPATPVSADTMNYSIVVTGGVLILSGVWYVVKGREEYGGPINEVS